MRRTAATLALFALLATAATAQTATAPASRTLTLGQVVARAQTAAFDVRIAQADAAVAGADAASARSILRPQLSVSGTVMDANEPQLGMPIARQAYGAASLSVPLSAPANALNARAAATGALAARTTASATINDAVFAAVQAYRRVQLGDAIVAARHAAVVDQQDHLRLTELRVATGKSARYLVLRDRASLATAQQAEEDAASERDQAAYDLAAMLDLGPDSITVEPLQPVVLNDTRENALVRALRQRPALVAAEQRVTAASAGIGAAHAAYQPSASLIAQSYNGSSSPYLGGAGGQIQLTASIPIVDGGSRNAALTRARAQYDRAVAVRDQLRAGTARDVSSAWREYEAATRNLATANAALADAQEQLRLAQLRQTAGKAIEVEVLDALSVAANARETVVRSIARYDVAVAAIHHAAGDLSP